MSDTTARRGLGRGLSALLGDAPQGQPQGQPPARIGIEAPVSELPIELIHRNPDQPRRHFAEAEMQELINSVREKGVLQPILVRPAPGRTGEYQIVAGERRWRAVQAARIATIPAVVRLLDDTEVLEIGIIENVQRADLNPLEEAHGYLSLIERFGRTQEQVSVTVGKSRTHVANALRLLNLPESVREHIAQGRITSGHARAIASAPDVEQLAERVVTQGLSVRQAESLARSGAPRQNSGPRSIPPSPPAPPPLAPPPLAKDPDTLALEQDLSSLLGLTVTIDDEGGTGELRVRYATLEQLDDLCRRLTDG